MIHIRIKMIYPLANQSHKYIDTSIALDTNLREKEKEERKKKNKENINIE